jgi:hypothetical protein
VRCRRCGEVADEQHGDEGGDDRRDEDHRVADEMARVELDQRINGRPPYQCRIHDGAGVALASRRQELVGDFNHGGYSLRGMTF